VEADFHLSRYRRRAGSNHYCLNNNPLAARIYPAFPESTCQLLIRLCFRQERSDKRPIFASEEIRLLMQLRSNLRTVADHRGSQNALLLSIIPWG
jgi:hypothetical protein